MNQSMEDDEEEEGGDSVIQILRDRFRLSSVSIAIHQAANINNLQVSDTVVACISDLAFKFTEQLGKDVELFAQHANRKSVNMEDVILSAHRNEHLAASLRSLADGLKAKEPHPLSERKRKKPPKNNTHDQLNT